MEQDNLTSKQNDYAIFLPAVSGFYATFIGKQRVGNYVDPARFPAGLKDMEQLNWLNDQKALFPYKWSLYSGGHANLDLTKPDANEDMIRNRDPNTLVLGDSGGFQIAKGLWEGDWRDPTSAEVKKKMQDLIARGKEKRINKRGKEVEVDLAKEYQGLLDAAQKKRQAVLSWLDGIANYGMTLDIPTWIVADPNAVAATGISNHQEAVSATKYNNEYFIKHRKGRSEGGVKILNVLQGANHTEAEDWYQTMKDYCDPVKYPGRHFDGWAMGAQNMSDIHLILKRLVALRYDNLLQQGVHDWMHFLGMSKLEYAVVLTVLQRAVRKYVNPDFTISFDCASPFLATANGQIYHQVSLPDRGKWSYRMNSSIDDKKYATDTRSFRDVALSDYADHFKEFDESPISKICQVKDICIYKPGDLNKVGKEGSTSWDSFSYALQMAHNVWTHIYAVQESNRRFDAGERPGIMQRNKGDHVKFEDVVERIFAAGSRAEAEAVIEEYEYYWREFPGTRGIFRGPKTINSFTNFNSLFSFGDEESEEDDSMILEGEEMWAQESIDKIRSKLEG